MACFHSVLAAALPGVVPDLLIGPVSESGQLAICIPIALVLFLSQLETTKNDRYLLLLGLLLMAAALAAGFSTTVLSVVGLGVVLTALLRALSSRVSLKLLHHSKLIVYLALPLMFTVVLLNLKRGPWVGSAIATGLVCAAFKRGLLIPLALICFVSVLSIAPIKDRLLSSYEHFLISGGRSEMWQVGVEVAAKYPLGIGFKNSKHMQSLDTNIPLTHDHFHNNLLNIVTETGWLGLSLFLWWICSVSAKGWQMLRAPPQVRYLGVGIVAGFIAFQIAGLVEYNFGDSEVLMTLLVTLGILAALDQREDEANNRAA